MRGRDIPDNRVFTINVGFVRSSPDLLRLDRNGPGLNAFADIEPHRALRGRHAVSSNLIAPLKQDDLGQRGNPLLTSGRHPIAAPCRLCWPVANRFTLRGDIRPLWIRCCCVRSTISEIRVPPALPGRTLSWACLSATPAGTERRSRK